jgi:hypothetical protein
LALAWGGNLRERGRGVRVSARPGGAIYSREAKLAEFSGSAATWLRHWRKDVELAIMARGDETGVSRALNARRDGSGRRRRAAPQLWPHGRHSAHGHGGRRELLRRGEESRRARWQMGTMLAHGDKLLRREAVRCDATDMGAVQSARNGMPLSCSARELMSRGHESLAFLVCTSTLDHSLHLHPWFGLVLSEIKGRINNSF